MDRDLKNLGFMAILNKHKCCILTYQVSLWCTNKEQRTSTTVFYLFLNKYYVKHAQCMGIMTSVTVCNFSVPLIQISQLMV